MLTRHRVYRARHSIPFHSTQLKGESWQDRVRNEDSRHSRAAVQHGEGGMVVVRQVISRRAQRSRAGRSVGKTNVFADGSVSRKKSQVSGLDIIYYGTTANRTLQAERRRRQRHANDRRNAAHVNVSTTLGHKKKRLDNRRPGAFSEGKGRKEKEQQTGLSCVV